MNGQYAENTVYISSVVDVMLYSLGGTSLLLIIISTIRRRCDANQALLFTHNFFLDASF